MKYIFYLLWAALALTSCFNTRYDEAEERRKQRIRDSIHADSVTMRRNTPDTTLATYKRNALCDGQHMITFDRVKMLSGEEAADYAKRHKRYGNNVNVVVNQEVTLETLPLAEDALILMIDDSDTTSTSEQPAMRRTTIADAIEDLKKEDVIQIIVLHRSIIYLRQLPPTD